VGAEGETKSGQGQEVGLGGYEGLGPGSGTQAFGKA
jgi:hypothetical protein